MDLELKGKRAIVTGGSRGIGKAIARQLALEGVDVAIAARTRKQLEQTADELAQETGRRIIPVVADTGDDASVDQLIAATVAELGGVDILVNNAAVPGGISPATRLDQIVSDEVLEDVNIKVVGYFRTARAVAPHLIANGWGRIINIGGLAVRKAGRPVASLRNVGVATITKSLADELGPKGINVTVVHPGATRTEGTDPAFEAAYASAVSIGRIVDAEEVAWVVAFLASPKSVSINGDAIATGGGSIGAIYYWAPAQSDFGSWGIPQKKDPPKRVERTERENAAPRGLDLLACRTKSGIFEKLVGLFLRLRIERPRIVAVIGFIDVAVEHDALVLGMAAQEATVHVLVDHLLHRLLDRRRLDLLGLEADAGCAVLGVRPHGQRHQARALNVFEVVRDDVVAFGQDGLGGIGESGLIRRLRVPCRQGFHAQPCMDELRAFVPVLFPRLGVFLEHDAAALLFLENPTLALRQIDSESVALQPPLRVGRRDRIFRTAPNQRREQAERQQFAD